MKILNVFRIPFIIILCFLSACHKDNASTKSLKAYPVTTFVGQKGNEKVMLNWESPKEGSPSTYIVSWSPGNGVVELKNSNKSYEVTGLSNGTEYTFSIQTSFADLGTSEIKEIKLTPSSTSNGDHLKENQILAGGSNKVLLFDQDNSNATFVKIWEWSPDESDLLPKKYKDSYFNHIDDCKPLLESNDIMITASTGGVAIVNRKTSEVSFYTHVSMAHSIEKLPKNKIAVAGSTSNAIFIFEDNKLDAKHIYKETLYGAHGLVWDNDSKLLFALGTTNLVAYEMDSGDSRSFKLKEKYREQLPTKGGHDLIQNPNNNKELIITVSGGVWKFDKEKRKFNAHSLNKGGVKSVSLSKNNRLIYVKAEESFWSHHIRFLNPGGSLDVPEINLYKARWVQ